MLSLLQNIVESKSGPNRSELKFKKRLNNQDIKKKTRRKNNLVSMKFLNGKEVLNLKNNKLCNSLVLQWLGIHALTANGPGSILVCGQKEKIKEKD